MASVGARRRLATTKSGAGGGVAKTKGTVRVLPLKGMVCTSQKKKEFDFLICIANRKELNGRTSRINISLVRAEVHVFHFPPQDLKIKKLLFR